MKKENWIVSRNFLLVTPGNKNIIYVKTLYSDSYSEKINLNLLCELWDQAGYDSEGVWLLQDTSYSAGLNMLYR